MKIIKCLLSAALLISLTLALGSKPADAEPALLETYWRLTELSGQKVSSSAPQGREAHLILKKDGAASGSGGLNRFTGQYTLDKNDGLAFLPAAATLMAGVPAAMETERKFFQSMAQTKKYKIRQNKLYLMNASGSVLAILEAVYL
ncbi:MAG: META domain-containing protein [Candidatus Margulisbacteria bacterium]|jgi:putative lipoprotein|nr:META domain-containing protein [Candidatus Margulisiibacteriota bacterium]